MLAWFYRGITRAVRQRAVTRLTSCTATGSTRRTTQRSYIATRYVHLSDTLHLCVCRQANPSLSDTLHLCVCRRADPSLSDTLHLCAHMPNFQFLPQRYTPSLCVQACRSLPQRYTPSLCVCRRADSALSDTLCVYTVQACKVCHCAVRRIWFFMLNLCFVENFHPQAN